MGVYTHLISNHFTRICEESKGGKSQTIDNCVGPFFRKNKGRKVNTESILLSEVELVGVNGRGRRFAPFI